MSNEQQLVHVPQPGEIATQDFGATAIERQGDLSVRAMAKQAEAQVQARYIMAMQNKRDIMRARASLLKDCERPFFAEKAIYRKPIGEGIEGPSIRLAEAAARAMSNILTDVSAIYDDDKKRIVRVMASDLESNVTYTKDVTVNKTVERAKPTAGRKIISQRVNSRGNPVFVIEATDDEILDREGALASKAMRTCLLRLIPGDILEEATQKCYETMRNKDAQDPDAARKKLFDAFGDLGVSVDQITTYLGHASDSLNPKELRELRGIYTAIKDGEATWAEAIASKSTEKPEPTKAEEKPAASAAATPPANLSDVAKKAKEARENK
jgi:hypothetical protein